MYQEPNDLFEQIELMTMSMSEQSAAIAEELRETPISPNAVARAAIDLGINLTSSEVVWISDNL